MNLNGRPTLRSTKNSQSINCKIQSKCDLRLLGVFSNNRDMTLNEFKRIYYMEHYHRVYGRYLGLAIILPSIFFSVKNWVSPRNKKFLAASSVLVVTQVTEIDCFINLDNTNYYLGIDWLVHGEEWIEG